jgi:predicted nucleic acid-binding protein
MIMLDLLIDTDVLIDYLRDHPQAVTYLEELKTWPSLSVVTVAELYAGVREGKERTALESLLETFKIIELSDDIAKLGGLFRRDYGKSHGIGIADALIAATAKHERCTLVTLNR